MLSTYNNFKMDHPIDPVAVSVWLFWVFVKLLPTSTQAKVEELFVVGGGGGRVFIRTHSHTQVGLLSADCRGRKVPIENESLMCF